MPRKARTPKPRTPSLGQILTGVRKSRGWTQTRVARILGCDPTSLTRYEAGESEPPIEFLLRMSALYGCLVDELVGGAEYRRTTAYHPVPTVNRPALPEQDPAAA